MRAGLVLTALLAASPTSRAAALAGDPQAGHAMAQKWCTNCHIVDSGQKRGTSTGAPTFDAIAQMKTTTEMGLHVFLQTPHDRMPDLHLTRNEIDDVSAYILSLKR
ncbi:c-type cytochrome [Rhodopila globiformis]|uniref:c-type cytochrome n=1 Tax=Rhodopila globiformis TaxID=1071 RepID=UPI0011B05724|nr:cytochrome c [Rhodopila globiformis]